MPTRSRLTLASLSAVCSETFTIQQEEDVVCREPFSLQHPGPQAEKRKEIVTVQTLMNLIRPQPATDTCVKEEVSEYLISSQKRLGWGRLHVTGGEKSTFSGSCACLGAALPVPVTLWEQLLEESGEDELSEKPCTRFSLFRCMISSEKPDCAVRILVAPLLHILLVAKCRAQHLLFMPLSSV
ncbi:hypothetical protein CB1_000912001 [Camelus ferus]|nr:hypothetical protein CB1_000912001 [Camelus ferus]